MIRKVFSKKSLATCYLVLLLVQVVWIEGRDISLLKAVAMSFAPIIVLWKVPYVSKAFVLGLTYWIFCIIVSYFTSENFRSSTLMYMGLFICTYIAFYNLLYSGAFNIDYAIKLVKLLIQAYVICLIGQQLCMLLGVYYFPVLNLINQGFLSLFKLPSLSLEPSHSARILGVLFLAFLKLNEYKVGRPLKLKEIFHNYKWGVIGFLYAMITMGSGTAFIALAILSMYFIKKQYLLYVVPILLIFYLVVPLIENKNMDRAITVFNASLTLDSKEIIKADESAAYRVIPLMNSFLTLDLNKAETWIGKGIDTDINSKTFSKNKKIGGITDYGLLGYILSLILVGVCCIRGVFTLETGMFIILLGAGISNIAYLWGCLMVFTIIKYYNQNYEYIK